MSTPDILALFGAGSSFSGANKDPNVAKFLTEVAKDIDINISAPLNKAVRNALTVGYEVATEQSPVWTGLYRSNWRVTLTGQSTYNTNESLRPNWGSHEGGVDVFSNQFAMSKGVSRNSISKFSINSHDGAYLTNNTSYADVVEQGTANRDPHQVMSKALTKMKHTLDISLKR